MDIYRGRDPRELAAYDTRRASEILRVPRATVRLWSCGGSGSPALLVPAQRKPLNLSFLNVGELFVLASIRRLHGVSMQKVRKALAHVSEQLGVSRPLVNEAFSTDGIELFVERAGALLNVSADGRAALREDLDRRLHRVEWEHAIAARFYPWVNSGAPENQPKSVVIDPRVRFGQPTLAGYGVPTRILAQRHSAGDDITAIAADYGIPSAAVEDALRFERREAA